MQVLVIENETSNLLIWEIKEVNSAAEEFKGLEQTPTKFGH